MGRQVNIHTVYILIAKYTHLKFFIIIIFGKVLNCSTNLYRRCDARLKANIYSFSFKTLY